MPLLRQRCARCAGPMFPDEDGDCACLMCGERVYDWVGVYTDRLLEAMAHQALRDSVRERVRRRIAAHSMGARLRWDSSVA